MTDDAKDEVQARLEDAEAQIFKALQALAEVGNEDAPLSSEESRARHRAALHQLRLGQQHLEELGELLRDQLNSSATRH